ncbi:kinesin-like protein KIN-6 isoform X1 [Actinidia eriantha]|uniref:kinesin-like protein KIN-6 isoform X1 n=1 Tax=Actinidia eriantha TaxID=165200 RepID=UPI00258BC7E6|nr:kinesin-like protein KIN-6 isoform X1 [Actinidia eriantha]
MVEINSPPPCPNTVTIRRNPHRRARATPSTQIPLPISLSSVSPSSTLHQIPPFPIQDILSLEVPQNPNSDNLSISESPSQSESENLKVFLRVRPLALHHQNTGQTGKARTKNAWPQNPMTKKASKPKSKKKSEICISVNDAHSVTLCPPKTLQDAKRIKTEVYEGFSHVFSSDSSQDEVFGKMVKPLVDDFLRGKSGMLAALGPSGSGKTHTVFGSPREPGMLPLALHQIFSRTEGCKNQLSRTFYLSMFEICSERGKAERILDLSPDVGDLSMQQSITKGLQEVAISDVQQAESLIARGMLKRATAMTNSNSQSSRSQCIINIRSTPNKMDEEVDLQSNSAVLTIVDLAGAEREKRTGNQGARLLESNFINNTSMVFGLCLRSLLEHQKNPKKPLQKHFQNSLLTRYLRDYLEGKKRMTLILTVKSEEEDFLDSSFLLRQASPYMKIKFDNVKEPVNSLCTKRHFQTLPTVERLKRMKLSSFEACLTNGGNGAGENKEEAPPAKIREVEPHNCSSHPTTAILEVNDDTSPEEGSTKLEKERMNMIMQSFAKALWKVLKEYKEKLKVAESQIQILNESLADEKMRRSELENDLTDLKSQFLCQKVVFLNKGDESSANRPAEHEGCHQTDVHEEYFPLENIEDLFCQVTNVDVSIASPLAIPNSEEQHYQLNTGVSALNLDESDQIAGGPSSDINVTNFDVVIASPLAIQNSEEQHYQVTDQECEDFPCNVECVKDRKDLKHVGISDIPFNMDASDSGSSESVANPPNSLLVIANDACYSVEGYQSDNEDSEERLDQPIMPKEDVAPESEPKLNACGKTLGAEKPKRRLLPASSILLKNINSLDFEDENGKPKGTRGEKLAPDERNRTQGSISLLRLLRSHRRL